GRCGAGDQPRAGHRARRVARGAAPHCRESGPRDREHRRADSGGRLPVDRSAAAAEDGDREARALNLVLLAASELDQEARVTLRDHRATHLLRVLKVAVGASVRIGVLDGASGMGVVEAIDDGAVTLRCAFELTMPPRPRVDLLLALP